jgi:molybdopterin synthase sulfur carrier subunit
MSPAATLTVQVRYFAALREALGAQQTVQLPAGSTVGDLRSLLLDQSSRHAELLARGRPVRCALNQVMADDGAVIPAGAEVAFFPPVTGG